ncbi:ribonuclease HI [Riemerella columbina]|uniref:ribonuclease HI n=1 Tax=Riemerella columbina TaxID=103810 RepID=UPI00266FC296|nr:ribonuclease HI [Riemerella columbina]WKS95003.1 ribonuclease HI [Riemerella columbina]
MKIDIYTDGACSGNPGKGGYGVLMRVADKHYEKTLAQGFRKTTNNRMELLAVIVALEKINSDGHEVHIYTDSKYVADAINKKWIYNWVKKAYKNVKNPDLWKRFMPLYQRHQPHFHWIKGHNGHPENERCDQLAVAAAASSNLEIDYGYEQPPEPQLF